MKKMSMILGLVGTLLLLVSGCGQSTPPGAPGKAPAGGRPMMPPPAVAVAKVDSIMEGAAKDVIGYLEAIQTVQIQPRVQGYVEKICFSEGTDIKKGDLLAEIEDTTYRAKAAAAKAVVSQNEAELLFARSNYHRQKQLIDNNAGTLSALDEAQREVDLKTAKLNESRANYLDAANNLQYTRIYAPIAGRVGRARFTEGNYVTATSAPLTEIVQIDPIYIRIYLSEREYQDFLQKADSIISDLINVNLKVRLANNEIYTAPWHIAITDNKIDTNTGTITLWINIENLKGVLLPGGYVTVSIAERHDKALPSISVSAILNDANTAYVYVLGEGNAAIRRDIKLGDVVGDRQIVTEGLSFGETVIVDGLHKVIPGMPVNPVTL